MLPVSKRYEFDLRDADGDTALELARNYQAMDRQPDPQAVQSGRVQLYPEIVRILEYLFHD